MAFENVIIAQVVNFEIDREIVKFLLDKSFTDRWMYRLKHKIAFY